MPIFFKVVQQPIVGRGILIIEDSWWHSDTPHSVGLFWTSDQLDADIPAWPHNTISGAVRTRSPNKWAVLRRAATGIIDLSQACVIHVFVL